MLKSRWFSPLALLAIWELGSLLGLIPSGTLAAPHAVVRTFGELIASGELPANLLVSLVASPLGSRLGSCWALRWRWSRVYLVRVK